MCCYLSALLLFQHSLGHWLKYFVAFSQLIYLSSWENSLRKSIDKTLLVGLFSLFISFSFSSLFVTTFYFLLNVSYLILFFFSSFLCYAAFSHIFFIFFFCHSPSFTVPFFNYILSYFLSLSLYCNHSFVEFFYFFCVFSFSFSLVSPLFLLSNPFFSMPFQKESL